MIQPLWKYVGSFFKVKLVLLYDPTHSTSRYLAKGNQIIYLYNTCTRMPITALLAIVKSWKQLKRPSEKL